MNVGAKSMLSTCLGTMEELMPQPSIQDYLNVLYTAHDRAFQRNLKQRDEELEEMILDLKLVIQRFERLKRPNYYT